MVCGGGQHGARGDGSRWSMTSRSEVLGGIRLVFLAACASKPIVPALGWGQSGLAQYPYHQWQASVMRGLSEGFRFKWDAVSWHVEQMCFQAKRL